MENGDDLSDYLQELVDRDLISYEKGLLIEDQLRDEYKSGKIDDDTIDKRFNELLLSEDNNEYNDSDNLSDLAIINKVLDNIERDEKLKMDFQEANLSNDGFKLEQTIINALDDDITLKDFYKAYDNVFNIPDEDIFTDIDFAVNFEQEDDREIFFEYILEEHGQHSLNKTPYEDAYPLEYELYMFNVLKHFKRSNNLIHSVIEANLHPIKLNDTIKDLLIEKGYVDESVDYDNWDEYADEFLTVKDLKEMLRDNNLKVSGKKQELIDRVRENNLSLAGHTTIYCRQSKKGNEFLKENLWMEFYNIFLVPYDFSDFYQFYKKHDGKIDEIANIYLDECIKLGRKNKNKHLTKDSITIKKLIKRYGDKLYWKSEFVKKINEN